jgi:hypothetical protein
MSSRRSITASERPESRADLGYAPALSGSSRFTRMGLRRIQTVVLSSDGIPMIFRGTLVVRSVTLRAHPWRAVKRRVTKTPAKISSPRS